MSEDGQRPIYMSLHTSDPGGGPGPAVGGGAYARRSVSWGVGGEPVSVEFTSPVEFTVTGFVYTTSRLSRWQRLRHWRAIRRAS